MTLERAIDVCQRWQDSGRWQTVERLNTEAASLEEQAKRLGSDAWLLLDRGDIETARQFKADADHLWKCAGSVRGQRAGLFDELAWLDGWIRDNRPELLELVPMPNDMSTPEAARLLRKLEGTLRQPTEPAPVAQPADKAKKRRRKPRMSLQKVEDHWEAVMTSGDRNLIADYLSAPEVELATKIGCSRGTLRKLEALKNRAAALLKFNRENR